MVEEHPRTGHEHELATVRGMDSRQTHTHTHTHTRTRSPAQQTCLHPDEKRMNEIWLDGQIPVLNHCCEDILTGPEQFEG